MLKHPVSEEHLKQIGDMTVSFALLENVMRMLVCSLVNEHQRIGQIITAELSFRNIKALARSLYIERHGKDNDFTRLEHLMKKAESLEERRNQITHSFWAVEDKPNSVTRIKITAKENLGYKFGSEIIEAKDLEIFVSEIKELAYDIQNFQIQLIQNGKAINNTFNKLW